MKIAFKKGITPWDWAIRLFSGGSYSHCEIIFSDGYFFSARPFSRVSYTHRRITSRWDVIDIPCTIEEEEAIRKWCDGELGCGYDWLGILRFLFDEVRPSDNRWFCSEICAAVLRNMGRLPKSTTPHTLHPTGLYNLCGKMKSSL